MALREPLARQGKAALWLQDCIMRIRQDFKLGLQQGGDRWSNGRQQSLFDLGATQIPESTRRKEGSLLSKARNVLALTAAPATMPGRETEQETVATFVMEAVQAGQQTICLPQAAPMRLIDIRSPGLTLHQPENE